MDLEQLKYPVGKFSMPANPSEENHKEWIFELTALPILLESAVSELDDAQLDTPYRPEGWTIRQVVHHLADSHMNAFCRIKLMLTEDNPIIKPYQEAKWAEMDDYTKLSISHSLVILNGLHARMVYILKNLDKADYSKTYTHPGYGKIFTLETVMALYAWHGRHHLAQITALKGRMGWD